MSDSNLYQPNKSRNVLEGIGVVAAKTGQCLGPHGAYFVLTGGKEKLKLSKRGIEVARELHASERAGNRAIGCLLRAADATIREAGDGGTTTIVIASAVLARCANYCETSPNLLGLVEALEELSRAAPGLIQQHSRPLSLYKEVERLATTVANGDRELGALIAKALRSAKRTGPVEIRGTLGTGDRIETSGGLVRLTLAEAANIALRERISRATNALLTTRIAFESGTVPGSGLVFLRVQQQVRKLALNARDASKARNIVADVCAAPLKQVLDNATRDSAQILDRLPSHKGSFGYDAREEQYGDLRAVGIIDSTAMAFRSQQSAISRL
jgi:chaperonin GroEL (HSP60 family)